MFGAEFFESLILYGVASVLIVLAAVIYRFILKCETDEAFLRW